MRAALSIFVLLVSAFCAVANDWIDLGDWTYRGKTYQDAKVQIEELNEVQILHRDGLFSLPWDQLDATLQFKLKPKRQALLKSMRPTPTAGPVSTPVPTPTPISDDTARLVEAYKANPIRADQEFRGKQVRVSGTVRAISRDILGKPYVDLGSLTLYFSVDEEAAIARLNVGQRIAAEGICDGKGFGLLSLSKCQLIGQ